MVKRREARVRCVVNVLARPLEKFIIFVIVRPWPLVTFIIREGGRSESRMFMPLRKRARQLDRK